MVEGASAGRTSSLDGLRAFAIAAVVLYHLDVAWLPSGHMGVVVFFVLTGYLITGSLVRRSLRTGRVPTFSFWGRRLLRVWPSLVPVVVGTLALCTLFSDVLLTKARPEALPSLLLVANWNDILRGTSYFDQIGLPSPLTHLWYVAVDLQLCVAWSLVLWVVRRVRGTLGGPVPRLVALGLAVLSLALMALLYQPGADPSRVYYGCDTRAFSFLLGAWLALAQPVGRIPRSLVRWADQAGLVALLGIVLVMVAVPADASFFYYGGMGLVSLLAVVLLWSLTSRGSRLARAFSARPLVWLGGRSYGVYLWHYPIIQLLDATSSWWLSLLAAALSLGAGVASSRFVEKPLQHPRACLDLPRPTMYAVGGTFAAVTAVALAGVAFVPDAYVVPPDAMGSTGAAAERGMTAEEIAAALGEGATVVLNAASTDGFGRPMPVLTEETAPPIIDPQDVELPDGAFVVSAPAAETAAGRFDPLFIGDSVPDEEEFYAWFSGGLLDAYVGRHFYQALSVFEDYLDQGLVGNTVIFSVFVNSMPTLEELERMLADAGSDRHVYLVGNVSQQDFTDAANELLVSFAAAHDNVTYLDWPAVSAGHASDWFWKDETHLRPEGAVAYTEMIARAVAPVIVADGGEVTAR